MPTFTHTDTNKVHVYHLIPRIKTLMDDWEYTEEQAIRAYDWEQDNDAEWMGDWMDPDNLPEDL